MNAPRHEIEARREKMRAIDRATEQLLAFEPLFVSEVIESKNLAAKLTFEVVLDVKSGEPSITVEVQSKGEPKAPPQVWKVHTYVCGKHAGFYEFTDRDEAEADMAQRKRDYGALGCSYRLEEPNAELSRAANNPNGKP
jgi:hypothetical protein